MPPESATPGRAEQTTNDLSPRRPRELAEDRGGHHLLDHALLLPRGWPPTRTGGVGGIRRGSRRTGLPLLLLGLGAGLQLARQHLPGGVAVERLPVAIHQRGARDP